MQDMRNKKVTPKEENYMIIYIGQSLATKLVVALNYNLT